MNGVGTDHACVTAIMFPKTGVQTQRCVRLVQVSDIMPIHLPHIWSPSCAGGSSTCLINATTVTQPMRATLDSFDTGFSLTSATELRVRAAAFPPLCRDQADECVGQVSSS
jgi:hypothetical protein